MLLSIDEAALSFLQQVKEAMVAYFGPDRRRIDHALQVTGYARELLRYIDADPLSTLSAAYLHDIGIPEAERKYGHASGTQQEIEGPPVARELLQALGGESRLVEQVCELIANHHTPAGIDSPEFRILWDADALVNLAEITAGKTREQIGQILDRWMVTEPGYRRACEIYL
ncbi:MAG: HD domain-containing protein [Desulfuromonadales bacterium]|nr:HD domain-containing protein [Desulfuromonadales bacterium]